MDTRSISLIFKHIRLGIAAEYTGSSATQVVCSMYANWSLTVLCHLPAHGFLCWAFFTVSVSHDVRAAIALSRRVANVTFDGSPCKDRKTILKPFPTTAFFVCLIVFPTMMDSFIHLTFYVFFKFHHVLINNIYAVM